jgi:hypothetical protein
MRVDVAQQRRNEAHIEADLGFIKSISSQFNRDELDIQLDQVLALVHEIQHRLTCAECKGEEQ